MTDFLLRQMRHGVWASEKLLERCRALTDEQLELTVPGTYGTIRKTIAPIVASEEGYVVWPYAMKHGASREVKEAR